MADQSAEQKQTTETAAASTNGSGHWPNNKDAYELGDVLGMGIKCRQSHDIIGMLVCHVSLTLDPVDLSARTYSVHCMSGISITL